MTSLGAGLLPGAPDYHAHVMVFQSKDVIKEQIERELDDLVVRLEEMEKERENVQLRNMRTLSRVMMWV